jgi:ABC-2 type transport system ATP-binding protein
VLTVTETLRLYSAAYPLPLEVGEVLELVGLDAQRNARVSALSDGQQRRLDLAIGIAGDPELLFLDEPTTGFDPSARRGAWDLVRSLASEGTTILLTTHYMDEAQHLADRVAVIAKGEIVAEGPPDTIGGRADAAARIRFVLPAGVGLDRLPMPAEIADGRVEVRATDEIRVLHTLTGWSLDNGVPLEGLTVERPSLEDVYLELTGAEPQEVHQ